MERSVLVIGGGLAGSEAAFQLAQRGIDVRLVEMRPTRSSPAHQTDRLAELVCSNSLRGAQLTNAVGLLKEELRRASALVIAAADQTSVPAGRALAVNREAFAEHVTTAVGQHPRISIERVEVTSIPRQGPAIVATGPLTSTSLAADLAELTGHAGLHYYDAIAPVVDASSLDRTVLFAAARYEDSDDYLNVPLDAAAYHELVADLQRADQVVPRPFEEPRYFEGCLPVEVLAARGPETLAHGPFKPVGLEDPRTGTRPYAVVQLRREDAAGTAYNLVGFQTRMKRGEQLRVLRKLPGLGNVSILRYGAVHRNTYVEAPKVLTPTLELKTAEHVYLAGQLAGVEGYVESAACGFFAGLQVASVILRQRDLPLPPPTTALGGLLFHLRGGVGGAFVPSNVTWAMMPPAPRHKKRAERRMAAAKRALVDLDGWLEQLP